MNDLSPSVQMAAAIRERIAETSKLQSRPISGADYEHWRFETETVLKKHLGSNVDVIHRFKSIATTPYTDPDRAEELVAEAFSSAQQLFDAILKNPTFYFTAEFCAPTGQFPASIVQCICDNFPRAARVLRKRRANHPPFTINDEYDVQDLLHSFLTLFFGDVRTEEWTPSYAGGCSRMDFLLKREEIVVEAKKTRGTLGAKEIGEELLVDIARYEHHPNCKRLMCFIYDPDHFIANPSGLENDLARESPFTVKVIVAPK